MKTIFLDFDGVLFDSVKEAYLLARYAFYGIPIKNKIDESHYKKFRKYRYLITHSWQFYIILTLIEKNIEDANFVNMYNNLFANGVDINIKKFDEKYVLARENLVKEDYKFWNSLDTPFDFFYEIKNLSQDKSYNFIILTNKKKLPVQNKLKEYKTENIKLFANEDLKGYKNKADFIYNYLNLNNIDKCILIEDSIDNIKDCEKYSQIKCLLANWGYVNPNNKGLNKETIIYNIKETEC